MDIGYSKEPRLGIGAHFLLLDISMIITIWSSSYEIKRNCT